MPKREIKQPVRKMSYYMNLALFDRLKRASFEDKLTVTDMIHNCVESYLDSRDKYYDPNDMQPEDLQKEQAEAEAEAEQWTPPAPPPEPEKEEVVEIEYSEDPPSNNQGIPELSPGLDPSEPFEF